MIGNHYSSSAGDRKTHIYYAPEFINISLGLYNAAAAYLIYFFSVGAQRESLREIYGGGARASLRRSPDKRFQTKAGYIRGIRRALAR